MGNAGRHDQALPLPENVDLPVHGKTARALQHRRQGVAAGGVGAVLLPLLKGEEGMALVGGLGQGAGDPLPLLLGVPLEDQVTQL